MMDVSVGKGKIPQRSHRVPTLIPHPTAPQLLLKKSLSLRK